jgi:hypothetical protein
MQRAVTFANVLFATGASSMPIQIEGATYHTAGELTSRLGITRQTLWRWRRSGKVPQGRRYRDGHTLFTDQEAEMIREFANRVEPLEQNSSDQLRLFNGIS